MSELEKILLPPEFEERCNTFIEAVEAEVVPKYPELQINPINETAEAFEDKSDIVEFVEKYIEDDEEREGLLRAIIRMGDREDRFSSFSNYAVVDVWDHSGKQETQVSNAADDVIETSLKFKPEESFRDEFLDLLPLNIHLGFFFLARFEINGE